jgi:hypothetical protein
MKNVGAHCMRPYINWAHFFVRIIWTNHFDTLVGKNDFHSIHKQFTKYAGRIAMRPYTIRVYWLPNYSGAPFG